ncbi:MAG: hypothetical protein ACRC4T_24400 [Cetobacterium sp.]
MSPEIKKYHKIVYRAMEFQFENFDTLKKLNTWVSFLTVALSIILLVSKNISEYLVLLFKFDRNKIDFSFFILNIALVVSSIIWLIITSKYDITLIGIKAEKYKNIQNKIREAKDEKEAKEHFENYLKEKPEMNDLFFVNKIRINKRLKENYMHEYCYNED